MLRASLFAAVLLTTMAIPAGSLAAQEEAALPAWLQEQLDARGIDVGAKELRVMRTVTEDGVSSTFEVPLSALLQEDPLAGHNVAPASAPEVLAGDLTFHFMVQYNCAGYGIQEAAPGIGTIQDASWDFGLHFAMGPLAGGAAVGTGAGPTTAPTNLFVLVNSDAGMSLAAGEFSATYDRISIFGTCLVGIGQMSGTGAWVFS